MSVIATCTDETTAEKIVDALNLLQKEIVKLDTPAQRALEGVREQLNKETLRANAALSARGEADRKVRALEADLNIAKQQRDRAIMDRDVAHKAARESA